MKNIQFKLVADGISLLEIPFAGIWTGSMLIRKPGFTMLIDSGADAAGVDQYLVPALQEQGLKPEDVDLLLSTHTHGDHVGGHARLRELGVKEIGIYAGGAEKLRDPLKYNIAIRSVFPEYSAPPAKKLTGVKADRIVQDGEEIAGVQLLAAPGHDTDAVVYFDKDTGTLLTGDSIQGNGTATLGCALYMDLAAYENTLWKLMALPVRQVVTGHPFYPWENAVIPGRQALADSLDLIGRYDELVKAQKSVLLPERTVELIRALEGRVPEYLFLGMYTVREHLKKLKGISGSLNLEEK